MTAFEQRDRLMLGAVYMVLAMLMGASIDVSVKTLTAGYGTAQIVFLRSLFALPVILIVCVRECGLARLATPHWGWQLYRGALAAGSTFGFFYGLAYLELVTAVLLAYVSPVLIVLLARPVLGERVGLHQWLGISIALGGVLTVLQPTRLDVHPAAFAIIGSGLCWALLSLSNRRLAQQEPAAVLAFYTLPVSVVVSAVLMIDDWSTPVVLVDWLLLGVAGVTGGFVHIFAALAYRHAPPAVIAPLEYTTLIWAGIAGYLFWGEIPTVWIVVGGAAVMAGGYIAMQGRG
ncbi:MAG: DMT family transporter [Gammaproteobacteria bacterium]|nr:DMT family transporter [Gammaproteobacteria bacterium]